jgi:hypothetical protein
MVPWHLRYSPIGGASKTFAIVVFWPCILGVSVLFRTTDRSDNDFFNSLGLGRTP